MQQTLQFTGQEGSSWHNVSNPEGFFCLCLNFSLSILLFLFSGNSLSIPLSLFSRNSYKKFESLDENTFPDGQRSRIQLFKHHKLTYYNWI